jgi:hypothetical protein
MKDKIVKAFPHDYHFKRQYFFRIKSNKKAFDFKIEDTEWRTKIKVPPGVADMDMAVNLTSSLSEGGGNFRRWKVTYSGRMDCLNHCI